MLGRFIRRLRRRLRARALARLPGLLRQHDFRRQVKRERARSDRTGRPFALVVVHLMDDGLVALARLPGVLEDSLREVDDLGWFGDEEVGLLLPETDGDGAGAVREKLARALAAAGLHAGLRHYVYRPGCEQPDGCGGQVSCGSLCTQKGQPRGQVQWTRGAAGGNGDPPEGGDRDPPDAGGGPGPGSDAKAGPGTGSGSFEEAPAGAGAAAETGKGAGAGAGTGTGAGAAAGTGAGAAAGPALAGGLGAGLGAGLVEGPIDGPRPRGLSKMFLTPLPPWKRLTDILGALVLLVLTSPLLLAAAAAVKVSSPGPVIFRQRRAGLGGHPFWFYKFRTMYRDAEQRKQELMHLNEASGPVFKMERDPRVTPVGRVLRRLSIDELPQLWNVLRGDMSLVGPRPPTLDEVPSYSPWQRRRLEVTGGLTCIWQVSGRCLIPFEEWMRMDLRYTRSISPWTDLVLLLRTVGAVASRRGAK